MPNKRYDIYERIFKFNVEVINLVRKLPRSEENQVIIEQILRSVTSMGANSEEADGASTNKDFVHCLTTVRKEGKETHFWLRLIVELNAREVITGKILVNECSEIIAIISKIISKSRK